jgi:hypothetical protein
MDLDRRERGVTYRMYRTASIAPDERTLPV